METRVFADKQDILNKLSDSQNWYILWLGIISTLKVINHMKTGVNSSSPILRWDFGYYVKIYMGWTCFPKRTLSRQAEKMLRGSKTASKSRPVGWVFDFREKKQNIAGSMHNPLFIIFVPRNFDRRHVLLTFRPGTTYHRLQKIGVFWTPCCEDVKLATFEASTEMSYTTIINNWWLSSGWKKVPWYWVC